MTRIPKSKRGNLVFRGIEPADHGCIGGETGSHTPFAGVVVGLAIMLPIYAAVALALAFLD